MKRLTKTEHAALIDTLRSRFEGSPKFRDGMVWAEIEERLLLSPDKLWTLSEMERTGGEPNVVGRDEATGEVLFFDCAAESPKGRRSLCYDGPALAARKKHKPAGSAVDTAAAMGAALLTEAEYRALQALGPVDQKTSSWLETPPDVRRLGGAIFGDFRYGTVFVYHNGADSYYAARGFRCGLRV